MYQIFNVFHVPVAAGVPVVADVAAAADVAVAVDVVADVAAVVDVAVAADVVAAADVAAGPDAVVVAADVAVVSFGNAAPVISFALHVGSFEPAVAAGRVGYHCGFLHQHFDDFWRPMVFAGVH